ncbi:SGNH hydrolase-type esterase domain-containing protein [Jimgerdemannia flammicorona]|uniref:SGNH hydrolase-type esterase domain-containing protein n=2 Tax=Jimgerdemannia flammicorona TaxID=994334 RepID=A0A433PGI7_9FUNG|nr:SGNH hydrolase-type esterase domain-containing protein [Jimgerdemannia flammicorona]
MVRYSALNPHVPQHLRALIAFVSLTSVASLMYLLYLRPMSLSDSPTDNLGIWKFVPKERYPFCQRCGGPEIDPICDEYGDDVLRRSLAHEGTSRRLREKIKQAQRGKPIKFAVLGGSVSVGHGIDDRTQTYHQRVFSWWNTQFPHADNTFVQGSVPATDSAYFAYCFHKRIPRDVDIVLIEFALNDGSPFPSERNAGDPLTSKMMESLVRNILRLPSKPAIIFISFFSYNVNEYFDGQESHLPVANYYDITFISMKNVLYDHVNRYAEEFKPYLFSDGHHPTQQGHRIAADFITHHIQQQVCALNRRHGQLDDAHGKFSVNMSLPIADMWTKRPDYANFRELEPTCDSFSDQSYRPKETHGWNLWNWQGEKFYIVANEPGANVTFTVSTNQGVVYLYVLKSKSYSLGDVWCWADDNKEKGTQISGYWTLWYSVGVMVPTVDGLSAGKHELHCEVLPAEKSQNPDRGTNFRILAIMSG